jgi:FlaA1/EpsC-like NDP-sugar epimerase
MDNEIIEYLLGRPVIDLNYDNIKSKLNNKTILVTGAAGSIGSEMVKQILTQKPQKIILLDQAESAIYDLELKHTLSNDKLEIVIGDIKNSNHMRFLFNQFRPEIIFHAAAYKNVPLMESNPCECILTNIFGTKVLLDLSLEFRVEKFIMISTDKAVNPTSVMGATKRIAEIYAQELNEISNGTQFITTRFGNVLGSNGSVIYLFKNQIKKGGPITITDKNVMRYFMTIPEACNLVLEAGAMGNGGEVFVFDMGEPIRVYDLALKMIAHSGLNFDEEIEIQEIGLRPGEKLFEELFFQNENVLPTHHPKIKKARVAQTSISDLSLALESLFLCTNERDEKNAVQILKDLVPEYISKNSTFSELDIKAELKSG